MSLNLNTGSEVRAQCRKGDFTSPTAGHAPGFVQANLVIVPAEFAYDFLLFCHLLSTLFSHYFNFLKVRLL